MTAQSGRPAGGARTVVHLLRHGEVHNPGGVLYGRLAGYHLSELGRRMAERVAEVVAARDVAVLVASPLERAQETAAPIASQLGLAVVTDPRVVEAGNRFQGMTFGVGAGSLRRPGTWWHLRNPMRPSWGEPYRRIAARMMAAMADARAAALGREAVIVSHQLPIWTVRLHLEDRRLWHDPRRRHCTLASLTSVSYDGDHVLSVSYSEPAADLLPVHSAAGLDAGA